MSQKIINLVYKFVRTDYIFLFSKTHCPHCAKVKRIFDSMHQSFTALELDERNDGDDIQLALEKITGEKTVPRVFIDEKFVGGASVIEKLYQEGKLQDMLKQKDI